MDGAGYPRGLTGGKILAEARVLSVADIFEAVSSHRPYRAALGMGKAIEILKGGSGSQLDAEAVGACLAVVERSPRHFTDILDIS